MAKSRPVPVYLNPLEKERFQNYLAATSGESMSNAMRRAFLEKVAAWEERQSLVKKQLGAN